MNEARNESCSVTEVLPDQRHEGEGITEFTMRKLRNEIIEQCLRAARKAWPTGNYPLASENTDVYRGQDHAAITIFKAIQGLKR